MQLEVILKSDFFSVMKYVNIWSICINHWTSIFQVSAWCYKNYALVKEQFKVLK